MPEADPEGLSHVISVWMDALTNYLSDLCPADGSIGVVNDSMESGITS